MGGLALSAAPLFAGPVSISPEKDKKGPRTPNESAPSPPADTTSRTEVNSPVLPGSGVAVEEAKEAVGWRRGPGAGGTSPSSASFRDGNNVLGTTCAARLELAVWFLLANRNVFYVLPVRFRTGDLHMFYSRAFFSPFFCRVRLFPFCSSALLRPHSLQNVSPPVGFCDPHPYICYTSQRPISSTVSC